MTPPTAAQKARVFRNGRSQAVRIPAEFRFATDEVYVERDPRNGSLTLSEKPLHPSVDEIEAMFAEFDAAGGADFVLERDHTPAPDRNLF